MNAFRKDQPRHDRACNPTPVFEVEVSTAVAAEALQDRLSQFEHDVLRPLLDDLFQGLPMMSALSGASSGSAEYVVDRLELNLGDVSRDQLENELKARIPSAMEQALTRKLQTSTPVSSGPETFADESLSLLNQLEYYLKHGVMHWSARKGETPDQLLKRCLDADPRGLRLLLLTHGSSDQVLRRLANHFDYLLLQRLVSILAPYHAGTASNLVDDLQRIQHQWPTFPIKGKGTISWSASEACSTAWSGIFAVLLATSSELSTIRFTQSVLDSMAAELGLSKDGFAELLQSRARLTTGTAYIQKALSTIIDESDVANKELLEQRHRSLKVSNPTITQSTALLPNPLVELQHLLHTGALASFGGQLPRLSITTLISELLENNKKELLDTLRTLAHRPDQLGRLLKYLPRSSLEKLILAIAGSNAGFVLIYLLAFERAVDMGRLPTKGKDLVWLVVLGRILDPDRGPVIPAEVVGELTYRTARRLGLSEVDLLTALYKVMLNAPEPRFNPLMELFAQRIYKLGVEIDEAVFRGQHFDAEIYDASPIDQPELASQIPLPDSVSGIVHFIRYGSKLDNNKRTLDWDLDAAISNAIRNNAAVFRDKMIDAIGDPIMLQRLVLHVSEDRLAEIEKLIHPRVSSYLMESLVNLREALEGESIGSLDAPWSSLAYQALLPLVGRGQFQKVEVGELHIALLRAISMQPGWTTDRLLDHLHVRQSEQGLITSTDQSKLLDKLIQEVNAELPMQLGQIVPQENGSYQKGVQMEPSGEPCYLENAGQVLLWPFLERYFASLEMLQEGKFPNIQTASRAAYLIEYLVHGVTDFQEHRQPLNKVLCGLSLEQALLAPVQLTETEKSLCEELLFAVTQHWTSLRNTSIAGLRESFLQREGRLERIDSGWSLTVDSKPYDMLLDQLQWGISTIRLPWMTDVLHVKWR